MILMADNDGAGTTANREAAQALEGAACTVVTADYRHDGPDGGGMAVQGRGRGARARLTA